MDKLFKYYALDGSGIQGANKRPINHTFSSAEAAFKISAFCLESAVPGLYRLLAKNPTNIQKYHYFNIKCPNCGKPLFRKKGKALAVCKEKDCGYERELSFDSSENSEN